MSNEQVSDERLAEMLRIEQRERARFAAGTFSFDQHSERISILTELQRSRASAVTPEMVEAAARAICLAQGYNERELDDVGSYSGLPLWMDKKGAAHSALTAALSVSHETGDGETETAGLPDPDQILAANAEAYDEEVRALRQRLGLSSAPTDETQGVKREPVAWRGMGPDGVPDVTLHAYIAEQWEADGVVLDFLFSLSQLEAVERERDALKLSVGEILLHERNASHSDLDNRYDAAAQQSRAETAEASFAAMTKRIEVLEGALKPFSEAADNIEDYVRDTDHMWESAAAMGLNAREFRAARAALSAGKNE